MKRPNHFGRFWLAYIALYIAAVAAVIAWLVN
jgi:hypothetical protein